jgi:uncharacterized protein YbaR (Trm112 family)
MSQDPAESVAPESTPEIDPEVLAVLSCPLSGTSLRQEGKYLVSQAGHRYPIVQGIPLLLPESAETPGGSAPEEG